MDANSIAIRPHLAAPPPRGFFFLPLFWTMLFAVWAMALEMALDLSLPRSTEAATVVVLNSSLDSLELAQGRTLRPSPWQVLGLTLGLALCHDRG